MWNRDQARGLMRSLYREYPADREVLAKCKIVSRIADVPDLIMPGQRTVVSLVYGKTIGI